MIILERFIPSWILLILTLGSGIWLSHKGKPLNTAIFTLHKLIALAGVVITAIPMVEVFYTWDASSGLILAVGLAAAGILVLFITGALMSIGKLSYNAMRGVHIVAAGWIVIALAVASYTIHLPGN